MKKVLFLFLGVLLFAFAQAQDTTAIANNNGNTQSVDSVKLKIGEKNIVVVSKQKKLKDGIDNLQKGLGDFQNKIDQKRQEIEIWSDSIKILSLNIKQNGNDDVYELAIDSLKALVDMNEDIVDALNDGIEEITESIQDLTDQINEIKGDNSITISGDSVEYDIDDIDSDNFSTHKKHKKFKGHWASVQLGLNSYTTNAYSLGLPAESDYMSVNLIQSREFAINPLQLSIPFFNKYVGAVTGLGFTFNNYELLQNMKLSVASDGSLLGELDAATVYKKNRFKTVELTAPLFLEFQIPVNKSDDRIFLSAGVIGSYTLNSKMKYVYYYQNTKIKNKDKSTLWPVNEFNYAASVRLGFNNTYFYVNYTLMPLFKTGLGPEIYPVTAGIAFSF